METILVSQSQYPDEGNKTRRRPAVQVEEVGSFARDLRAIDRQSAKALDFLLLTCVRSKSVLHARWTEVDLDSNTWIIPEQINFQRMNYVRAHRVPLSKQAIALLGSLERIAGNDFLFPSSKKGEPLPNSAMNRLMREMGYKSADGRIAVPHGLRSTFAFWAFEHTVFRHEILAKVLGRSDKDSFENALLRGDALEDRRKIMQMWADFCSSSSDELGSKVVPFHTKAA